MERRFPWYMCPYTLPWTHARCLGKMTFVASTHVPWMSHRILVARNLPMMKQIGETRDGRRPCLTARPCQAMANESRRGNPRTLSLRLYLTITMCFFTLSSTTNRLLNPQTHGPIPKETIGFFQLGWVSEKTYNPITTGTSIQTH